MAGKDDNQSGLLNLNDPNMKTSYANYSHVYINGTDIYLYFGIQEPEGAAEDVKMENRIVLTHDSFMRMMEFWSTRYSALVAIYGDTPKNLHDFEQATVRHAFVEFLGQTKNERENPDANPTDE